jgi:hypothetical protein
VPQVDFAIEPWHTFWPDAAGLMQEEFDEYAQALKLWKPPAPDTAALEVLHAQGALVLTTARVNGALGAYLTWFVSKDIESIGHTLYHQGPFFASKRFARYALGMKLLRRSLKLIQTNSPEPVEVDLHHPPVGRGLRLDRLFVALGAVQVSVHYRLKLSSKECA